MSSEVHATFFLKYDLSHECSLRIDNYDIRTEHHANRQYPLKLSDSKN